uniref:chorismate mutase n=1 Tax=Pyramimonas obovata TaxID=1411642 RepID=A0A7S0RV80_9CHLO|eukprot:CAMPEP_0118957152 /NCGR_PEP_ID=MMETSP1169-20130426/61950_1 /TAXON_ID=36882 /ORGANISM="Pyramimonas obovata, Strain CCMP722" /LENGTH=343 /DNA_ID=CAMNT_0006905207 /DNA_START=59 /DNA_END=1090 /DNA_ORIENTATION=+
MAQLATCTTSSQATLGVVLPSRARTTCSTPAAATRLDKLRQGAATFTRSVRLHASRGPRRARRVTAVKGSLTQPQPQSSQKDVDLSSTFSLDEVRQSLIRQEDSIIFSLIERAQFKHNDVVYQENSIAVPLYDRHTGTRASFLEYYLRESEQMHGKMRRYTSPDEMAFYPESLPPLVLPPLEYPSVLVPQNISLNDEIVELYTKTLVPAICEAGDDNNYGSTCMFDVQVLQALSKRIHYGKFVAEAKFRSNKETYTQLIKAQDAEAIMDSLTFPAVEKHVVDRVTKKAATYGQDVLVEGAEQKEIKYKVPPEMVGELYSKWIMPLTKKVQVLYLLKRLDHEEN